jgi:DNA-binding SARP family transcriptional activator
MAAQDAILFRVLGPVGAETDGRALHLGPPLQRTLLGALVLHHDEVVPVDTLVDMLWGEHPPRTAAHSLQSYVSGLRAVLGPDRIETRPPGYLLHATPDEVDADRFDHTVEAAATALAAGDAKRALALLDTRSTGGAAHRWPTSPTTGRSPGTSPASRNCTCARWSAGSPPSSPSAAPTPHCRSSNG